MECVKKAACVVKGLPVLADGEIDHFALDFRKSPGPWDVAWVYSSRRDDLQG